MSLFYSVLFRFILFSFVFVLLFYFVHVFLVTQLDRCHELRGEMFAGLLDNVLSDYLWAKAVLLTSPTAATTGLTIQVPIAGVVDSLRGKIPSLLSVLGAAAVLLGFFGINEPATGCFGSSGEDADNFDNVKQSRNVITV